MRSGVGVKKQMFITSIFSPVTLKSVLLRGSCKVMSEDILKGVS